MKIIAISDTHTFHNNLKLPAGDLLIHAGDACSSGKEHEFLRFANWFDRLDFKYKIFVAGNHDRFVEQIGPEETQRLLGDSVHYLQDSGCCFEGFNFWGTPWTPPFMNWAFNADDEFAAKQYAKIPEWTNVLISHGPACDTLDLLPTPENVGSVPLMQRLAELKRNYINLKYHIFGHIHCNYGVMADGDGFTYVNAAICTESYNPTNAPILLHIRD